ncbi:MAG TPA: NAD-dependent epimerase/dehydratase family protein [Bacteroidales bacterium]|nr:NAD-dependent epimerase/dehydratase family protein [Bacteroidales bacterium]
MRVITTGATGFIGSYFVTHSSEYHIKTVDLVNQNIELISFKGYDCILHLAALVHQMKGAPESDYFRINRDLAVEVAQKAKKDGVKQFILMSTAKVYGESTTGLFNLFQNFFQGYLDQNK